MIENEIESWWTAEETAHCQKSLIIGPVETNWYGRKFRQVTSLAKDNIYGQRFTWREYGEHWIND